MTLGVTVLPEWPQVEGIDSLLDRLQSAGVTDIATSPYVMEPAADGAREPPADAGAGKVRLLDRELWGHRQLKVRTAPSFSPDVSLYEKTHYKPPTPNALTLKEGHIVDKFISAAKSRGINMWFQVQAAIPPGYRVQFGKLRADDVPLGPDSDAGPGRVDNNASLASRDVLEYGKAMLRDLVRAYPQIDGIRLDWPEYPPYSFHSLFFDFSKAALIQADDLGIDTVRMRADTLNFRQLLVTNLAPKQLHSIVMLDEKNLRGALNSYPGVHDLMTLKQHLSLNLIKEYRSVLPDKMALVPQAFPPPFNLLTGFDYGSTTRWVQGIGVKLYTMHWPMILSDWSQAMSGNNVNEAALAKAMINLLGTGQVVPDNLKEFHYPEPDEPHPASSDSIRHKLLLAKQQIVECPMYAFTHSYGPLQDVTRRAKVCWEASNGHMWVNRYAYLSDEKIAALGDITR